MIQTRIVVRWMTLFLAAATTTSSFLAPRVRSSCWRQGEKRWRTNLCYSNGYIHPWAIRQISTRQFGTRIGANNNNGDNDKDMTVQQIWTSSLERLQQQGVSEPEWSVAHLLASAMDLPWSNGFSQLMTTMQQQNAKKGAEEKQQVLTVDQYQRFQSMLERRIKDEPLQYILGKWDFLHYEQLVVRPPLLCPRPETEELVELVRKDIQPLLAEHTDIQILDVGCGTGVIGISLADAIPNSHVVAIDVEPIAVATSLENAKLVLGSEGFDSSTIKRQPQYSALECGAKDYTPTTIHGKDRQLLFDVVVSNPPYIPRDDMSTLSPDVVRYESDRALCGGDDGMDVIRDILQKWATEWGRKPHSVCWMEVDPSHPSLLQSWLEKDEQQELGVVLESTHEDLSGRDRFVKFSLQK